MVSLRDFTGGLALTAALFAAPAIAEEIQFNWSGDGQQPEINFGTNGVASEQQQLPAFDSESAATDGTVTEPLAQTQPEQAADRRGPVRTCPTTSYEIHLRGLFDEKFKGSHTEYCLHFRPDGTFAYIDAISDATGTWTREASVVTWEARGLTGKYTWNGTPLPTWGKLTGVTYDENGIPESHVAFNWRSENKYGNNNIEWDLAGSPAR